MATIAEISRGLNAVRTYGQAKIAIGEALRELGRAYRVSGGKNRVNLDRARLKLEGWFREIERKPDHAPIPDFQARRDQITVAYVESAGIVGELEASRTVSFLDELGKGFAALPAQAGEVLGAVAGGVGTAAGGLLGGLLKGLGPVVVIVIAIAVYVRYFAKGKS